MKMEILFQQLMFGMLKKDLENTMAKTIHTDKAPAAIGPYVQGKIVGNLLFASGQVPLSPETGEIIGETIQEQTEQVLKNIGAILEEAGTDFDHVVKTTCFLSDMNDFVPFNEVYTKTKRQSGEQETVGHSVLFMGGENDRK